MRSFSDSGADDQWYSANVIEQELGNKLKGTKLARYQAAGVTTNQFYNAAAVNTALKDKADKTTTLTKTEVNVKPLKQLFIFEKRNGPSHTRKHEL